MMRLAAIPERAAQGAQGEAQAARQAAAEGVQSADGVVAAQTLREADHIGGRNPFAAGEGSVSNQKQPFCSFIVKNDSVECQTVGRSIQYNASNVEGVGVRGADENGFSVANGRIHAGTMGAEGDARALAQERLDDFAGFGCGQRHVPSEKV